MDTLLFSALTEDGRRQGQLPPSFQRLEELLARSLAQGLSPAPPADPAGLEERAEGLWDQVRTLALRPFLRGKTLVALGGCFSSGKSSLLNALLGRRLLPAEIVPTTAVPTYLLRGEEEFLSLCNRFSACSRLPAELAGQLVHGYYCSQEDDAPRELSHLVRDMALFTPAFPYPHLALLDTPGFSGEADLRPSRRWLEGAHALIWVVNAEAGALTAQELGLLKSLPRQTPKLLVLNKCDKKTGGDLARIRLQIIAALEENGIPYEGVTLFSCRRPQDYQGAAEIPAFLEGKNQPKADPPLPQAFAGLFWECLQPCLQGQRTAGRRLNRLRLLAGAREPAPALQDLTEEIAADRQALREQQNRLETAQSLFLTGLERLGQEMGCPLPVPGEEAPAPGRDLLGLVRSQREKMEIPPGDAKYRLLLALTGLSPKMQLAPGGAEYPAQSALRAAQHLTFSPPPAPLGTQASRYARAIARGLWG